MDVRALRQPPPLLRPLVARARVAAGQQEPVAPVSGLLDHHRWDAHEVGPLLQAHRLVEHVRAARQARPPVFVAAHEVLVGFLTHPL